MRLEVKDKKEVTKYIGPIIGYLQKYGECFSFEDRERINRALEEFMDGLVLSDYLCLQIFDELGILPDEQNPYIAFSKTLNECFDVKDKNVIEIGGGRLLRLSKRIASIQDRGTITVYDTKPLINNKENLKLKVVEQKFLGASDAKNADVLIGLLATSSAETVLKAAMEANKDFMIALFNKQNLNLFCEDTVTTLDDIKKFTNSMEEKIADSNLGKLKIKHLKEIGQAYPIIYNERG